jgi:thermitase
MKQRIAFLFSVLAAVVFWSGQASSAEAIPGEYLVKYKGHSFVSMTAIGSKGGLRIMDHNEDGNLLKVKIRAVEEYRTLAGLMADPNVEYVVPNIKLRSFMEPVQISALKDQWANKKVNAQQAWARAGNRGSRNVLIAVIDTGVDYRHPSLAPNMVSGFDFRENDSDPMDKTSPQNPGHGTHCSGSIAGTGLVQDGIEGLSPEVSLMPLRFLGEDGSGDLNNGIKAIDYAIKNGAKIISASWGATVSRAQAQPLIDAVKRADDAGVIFVAAAANDGRNNDRTDVFPTNAGFPNMIAVAASGPNDEKASFSNYGKKTVHVAAPGVDIMSTLPGNKYGKLSGTSMATPLVAGLVGLLAAQQPDITGAQARALLQLTGAKTSIEVACNCRVDAFAAVDTLVSKKMFITPAAATLSKGETLQFSGTNGRPPFQFSVSNGGIGLISQDGLFTASGPGETTVTVTDSTGAASTSLAIRVVDPAQQPPDDGGGGGGGECPLGDPMICQIICQIQPDLPFCSE